MMCSMFTSSGAEWLSAKRVCKGNKIIRCNSQNPSQLRLKRRQMLLASSSVHLTAPDLMFNPNDQVSNLTDYHKLQDAQKRKFSYASDIHVSSMFRSSDPTCKASPAQFSGMVSVPSQQYCGGNCDFVQSKVARPAFNQKYRDRQEEVIIQGIKVRRNRPLWFDVYIRPAGREEDDEYAGSFIHVPPRQKRPRSQQQQQGTKMRSCCLRLGISHIIEDFDADQHRHIIVTLVPKFNADHDPISVEKICIEYS